MITDIAAKQSVKHVNPIGIVGIATDKKCAGLLEPIEIQVYGYNTACCYP